MEVIMQKAFYALCMIFYLFSIPALGHTAASVSEATDECLACHSIYHPGIVAEWQKSRHAMITPKQAMKLSGTARKISSQSIPDNLSDTSIGCAECHTLRPESHADTFEHNTYPIHVVVSPEDCATCHIQEKEQFSKNLMAHARKNLAGNTVYQSLQESIIGKPVRKGSKVIYEPSSESTKADACFYCHGTKLEMKGLETRDTPEGEMEFPRIGGWPNQGVGRLNLDGSLGACSACHTRHAFSIEMARKPHTCKECHVGPDVPVYKVYLTSKHGNIYSAKNTSWNFNPVPWTIGKDFTAPTCAACHVSLLENTDGEVVASRTHQMSDRLAWRIFGLVYSHPHPKEPDTTIIRNKDNLPLPTDFSGGFSQQYLIDSKERSKRTAAMQAICLNCHDNSWVKGHWAQYENSIQTTNDAVRTATDIMQEIWKHGYAEGIAKGGSPFDEAVEKQWSDTWLFYANTIRFSSAMAGGGDYGVFSNGRYQLSKEIQALADWLETRKLLVPIKGK